MTTKHQNFHLWFDAVVARAVKTSVGEVMTASGYTVHNTGGNCLGWQRLSEDGKTQLLISHDNGLGTKLKQKYTVGIYLQNGHYIEDEAFGVDAAITWCHQALMDLEVARKVLRRFPKKYWDLALSEVEQ